MDRPRSASKSSATLEILVARRTTGLHLWSERRGDAVHHARIANVGLARRDSPLVLFHGVAKIFAAVESGSDLELGHRYVFRAPRACGGYLDVLAPKALSKRRGTDKYSAPRLEALAHHHRADRRVGGGHMGIQRNAIDGSVPGENGRLWEREHARTRRRRREYFWGATRAASVERIRP